MERQPAKTFRDLTMWQKAHNFVLGVGEEPSLMAEAEEVAKLLAAYSRTLLSPTS